MCQLCYTPIPASATWPRACFTADERLEHACPLPNCNVELHLRQGAPLRPCGASVAMALGLLLLLVVLLALLVGRYYV